MTVGHRTASVVASRSAHVLQEQVASVTPHEVRPQGIGPYDLDGMAGVLNLPHTRLVFVRYGGSVTVEAPATGERVVATIPLGPMDVCIGADRRATTHHSAFVLSEHARTVMRPDPWAGALVLAVDSQFMAAHSADVIGDSAMTAFRVQSGGDAPERLASACKRAWNSTAHIDDDIPASGYLTAVEDDLLTALTLACDVDSRTQHPVRVRTQSLIQWLRSNHDESVTVTAMARVMGLSVRQLQDVVLRDTGLTPIHLLRQVRLDAAHRQLLSASSDVTTVAAVAYACGFSHVGRFSAVYAARFGEYPHATLRRAPW